MTIPAGIEDGAVLRVAGHGLAGDQLDIPPGDLYVVVSTVADKRFQRRGSDLWRVEAIEVADAVLGTDLSIPGLKESLDLQVPPGTQPDSILQIRGKGLPRFKGNGYGDINIRIQVRLPEKLSDQERDLYKKLRDLTHSKIKK